MIYSFSSPRFCPALSLAVLPLGSENEGNLAKPPPWEEEPQPWHYFYYLSVVAADSPQVKGRRQTGQCCVIVTEPSSRVAGVAATTGVFENKRAWLHLCKRRRRLPGLAATDAKRTREASEERRLPRKQTALEQERVEVRLQKKGGCPPPRPTPHTPSTHTHLLCSPKTRKSPALHTGFQV